jgi:hypothetical protein
MIIKIIFIIYLLLIFGNNFFGSCNPGKKILTGVKKNHSRITRKIDSSLGDCGAGVFSVKEEFTISGLRLIDCLLESEMPAAYSKIPHASGLWLNINRRLSFSSLFS